MESDWERRNRRSEADGTEGLRGDDSMAAFLMNRDQEVVKLPDGVAVAVRNKQV